MQAGDEAGRKDTGPSPFIPTIVDDRTLAAADGSPAPPDRLAVLVAGLPSVAREAYTIGAEVAKGGIGRVVRARDQRLDRPVAIKELLEWTAAQEQRFVREALLTARLQHPAIVPIYEAGRWPDGEPFYAMRLVSGRTLADRIGERTTLAQRLGLLPHVLTAAQAIAYAHGQRIIHRDLKPANVLVGEFGETVVIDWGLAKDLAEDEPELPTLARTGEGLTIQGAIVGTPSYMPPEQAAGLAVDERADVYALGAVLYHVLAAVPPYHETAWDRLLPTIAERPPRSIEQLAPQVSDELAAIVHKAMARDPSARYRTAKEMAEDLERFQTGQIVAAHTYSARQLLRRYWRRNRSALSVAALASGLVAAVVLAAFVDIGRGRTFAQAKQREAVEASRAADTARHAAEQAEAQATARADGMTLLQAQDALRRDPNQALAWLKTLSPGFADVARVRRIAAEAQARGVSRAFHGHTAFVNRVGLAADGTRFVTCSDDKTARVWDIATGESKLLVGHTDEVWNAQFSPDGTEVATLGKDITLRTWDAQTGALLRTVALPVSTREVKIRPDGSVLGGRTRGPGWILRPGATAVELLSPREEKPTWVYFSRSGRFMVVQPEVGEVYVRDLEAGTTRRLPGTRGSSGRWFLDERGAVALHTDAGDSALWDLSTRTGRSLGVVSTLRRPMFTARGDLVAFASGEDIHVFDTRTAASVHVYAGHEGPVQALVFAGDDRRLVSAGIDRTIRTWDLASGQSEVHAGFEGIPNEVEFLADGRSILAVTGAGEIRLFAPRRAGKVLTDHGAPATGLALAADGRFASIDDQGRLWIGDLDGRTIATHGVPPAAQVRLVAAPDGQRFAGVAGAWIVVADGRSPDPRAPPARLLLGTFDADAPLQVALPAAALDLAWLPDGGGVVVALLDGAVVRVGRDGEVEELERFTTPATSVAVTADGAWLAAGSEDGVVRSTELASGSRRELGRHGERITALAFRGDDLLASGAADHRIRLWKLADGTASVFDEGGHGVEQAQFSADGRTLLLLSGGETGVRRIDVETGAHLPALAGPGGRLLGFSTSADGGRMLTLGSDGAVRVIDVADGGGRTLAGHTRAVHAAGFAADGRVIVTLGEEGLVRAWPDDLPETMAGLRAWIEAATPERVAGR